MLRIQHPGLFRKMRIMSARDVYCGVAFVWTVPADLVPGGFPATFVGVLFIVVGVTMFVGAYRTHTADSRQVLRWEQAPIYASAALWAMWGVWSAWSYYFHVYLHTVDGGVRSMLGVGIQLFMARDAFNVAREPVRRFADTA